MRRPAHGEQAAPAFFRWQTESSDAPRSGAFQLSRFPFPPDRDRSLGRSALATPTLSRRFPGHSRHSSQFHTLRTTVQAPTKAKCAPDIDIGVKPRYCPFLSFRQGSYRTRAMPRQPRIQRRSTGPSGYMNDTKAPPGKMEACPLSLHSSLFNDGFSRPNSQRSTAPQGASHTSSGQRPEFTARQPPQAIGLPHSRHHVEGDNITAEINALRVNNTQYQL